MTSHSDDVKRVYWPTKEAAQILGIPVLSLVRLAIETRIGKQRGYGKKRSFSEKDIETLKNRLQKSE
jgi:hypothetical protein